MVGVLDLSIKLAGKVADAAAVAHGLPVPGVAGVATEGLLRELLAVHDEQAERLQHLESGIQNLIDRPWRSAQMHLREAVLPGRASAQVVVSLDRAALDLRNALAALPSGTRDRAYMSFELAAVLLTLAEVEASRMYARESLSTFTYLLKDEARKEFNTVAGPFKPGKNWPDRRKLQKYRPERSVRPALALDWLNLALAVANLTRDQKLIVEERRRTVDDSLHAIELQAVGNGEALVALHRLQLNERAEKNFEIFLELPVAVHSWNSADLPNLPQWWPIGGGGFRSIRRDDG